MPYYKLIEGEGIAGPFPAVTAETTALYSCMGIVFRNTGTNVCGLYHYGANTLHHVFVQNTILQMLNDIQPTDVYITAPPLVSASSNGQGSTNFDRNQVDLFLVQHAMGMVTWQGDRTFANYVQGYAGFSLNQGVNLGGGTRRSIEMATQMPSPNGRTMGGVATFYGGLGPKTPARTHHVDDRALG
ncbi:hypothetical protein [Roseomonas sp. AR75]|uniref:hypothetical protein n=1 Tax=Roseomonas sp. AR75 TaxID=2562311 RepID=UPI0010C0763A|nr:hypothetical protein [Roseomonas sp. AR75]